MLLTHGQPAQMLRLVQRLNVLFDNPDIVCHHDVAQCDLSDWRFPPNVRFVEQPVRTSWGTFSLVDATLRLLRATFESDGGPRWAVLLSGADYPAAGRARVLADLDRDGVDAHIQHVRIDERALDAEWYAQDLHRPRRPGEHVVDVGKAYDRYLTATIPVIGRKLWRPVFTTPFLPYGAAVRCYAGSQWFTINERAARAVLDFTVRERRVVRHYRRVEVPDESFFQTALAASPGIRLNDHNFRYTEWHQGEGHPKTLAPGDLPKVQQSGAHFARKVSADAPDTLIRGLDALCDRA